MQNTVLGSCCRHADSVFRVLSTDAGWHQAVTHTHTNKKGPYTDEKDTNRQYFWVSGPTQPSFNSIPGVADNNSRSAHTHTRTSQLHKQWGWSTSTLAQPPSLDEEGEPKTFPNSLPLSLIRRERRGAGGLQSAGIWHEQTLTKPSGAQRWRKSGGRGEERCHFQASSLWRKALRERENKTNGGRASISPSPFLSSMWRSVFGREVSSSAKSHARYLQRCSQNPDASRGGWSPETHHIL